MAAPLDAHHKLPELAPEFETALLDALTAPLEVAPASAAYALREQAFLDVVRTIPVAQCLTLRARLNAQRPGDHLASSFAAWSIERRTRVMNFINDARRRDALAKLEP